MQTDKGNFRLSGVSLKSIPLHRSVSKSSQERFVWLFQTPTYNGVAKVVQQSGGLNSLHLVKIQLKILTSNIH